MSARMRDNARVQVVVRQLEVLRGRRYDVAVAALVGIADAGHDVGGTDDAFDAGFRCGQHVGQRPTWWATLRDGEVRVGFAARTEAQAVARARMAVAAAERVACGADEGDVTAGEAALMAVRDGYAARGG